MKSGKNKAQVESISRREFLLAAGSAAAAIALDAAAAAEPGPASLTMALATQEAMRKVTGSAPINRGKVTLDLPALVENGNAVPLTVSVDSPMTPADHVKAIHIFTEKNPLPNVASFHLGPRAGRASITARMRVADSQNVTAICELSDGTFWSGSVSVVVTLVACAEDM
jgi:sulfur-oxidizing protein SoxY